MIDIIVIIWYGFDMSNNSILKEKSYSFALRIIKLYKYLKGEKQETVLSKQIVRSGTSIGANIEEAVGAQSENDFLSKISIAYKECRETEYWLRLLKDSDFIEQKHFDSIHSDCVELLKMLGSTKKTLSNKLK